MYSYSLSQNKRLEWESNLWPSASTGSKVLTHYPLGTEPVVTTSFINFQVEDLTLALDSQRSATSNMEKKQRKFDQTLAEAKAEAERVAMERDNLERLGREKETKILNLTRNMDELQERVEQLERSKTQQARELEDLVSSKDDVGKNVRFYCI